jgi:HSP20 family protein
MSVVIQPASVTESSISDWAGSPLSTVHHLAARPRPIPVEQYQDGSSYLVRFEVPGVDPATDLAVSVEAGTLIVQAQRTDSAPQGHQSEFRYGRYARHVALPPGSDARDVTATYRNGILTVRIGMKPEHQRPVRVVDVEIQQ